MIFKLVVIGSAITILVGCSSGGESGITIGDFRDAAKMRAGNDSLDCNDVEVFESIGSPENCISDSFSNVIPAFAVFEGVGIDSQTALAIAINSQSRVYKMLYDSDPTGQGSTSNGRIATSECINPQLSGISDAQEIAVISCE